MAAMKAPGEPIYFHGRLVGVWAKCPGCGTIFSKPPGGQEPMCPDCKPSPRLG